MKRPFLALCTVLTLLSSAAYAGDDKMSARAPVPVFRINTDKGDKCVEPEDVMRRDHMKFILHQRDKTMHEGIRTTRHSLKNCIDCHADSKTGSVLGKEGFCESCHAYASVKIDCFECHSSVRETSAAKSNAGAPLSSVRAPNAASKNAGVPVKGKKP